MAKKKKHKIGEPLKNPNHEKFAQKYAEAIMTPGKKVIATQIYKEVYPVQQHTANANGHIVASNPLVKARVQEVLDANGLTIDRLTKKLQSLTEAKKTIFFEGRKVAEVEDLDIQLKANKLGFELQRALPSNAPTENNLLIDNRSINLELSDAKNVDKLAAIASTFAQLRMEKNSRSGVVKASSLNTSPEINSLRASNEQQASEEIIDAKFSVDSESNNIEDKSN